MQILILTIDNRKDLEFNSVAKLKSYGYELFLVYTAEDEGTTNRRYEVLERK